MLEEIISKYQGDYVSTAYWSYSTGATKWSGRLSIKSDGMTIEITSEGTSRSEVEADIVERWLATGAKLPAFTGPVLEHKPFEDNTPF